MRKGFKERFSRHSFIFVIMMVVGINMFVFVFLAIVEALLTGYTFPGLALLAFVAATFVLPFRAAKKQMTREKGFRDVIKTDVFLFSFTTSFIIVGILLAIGTIYYHFYM